MSWADCGTSSRLSARPEVFGGVAGYDAICLPSLAFGVMDSNAVPNGRVPDAKREVSGEVTLGEGTRVWDLVQIREGAQVGAECVIGRGAYVGVRVVVGDRCKIQNNALVYDPAVIGDGVFIGPGAILTNDRLPRAITPSGELKRADDWDPVGVTIDTGASIGAGAVCVAPVRIGAWAMVAAGSVVVRDVPDHALVAGNPARQIGWVGRDGRRMAIDGDVLVDESTGARFLEVEGRLAEES